MGTYGSEGWGFESPPSADTSERATIARVPVALSDPSSGALRYMAHHAGLDDRK
jgi:hypothetical protein